MKLLERQYVPIQNLHPIAHITDCFVRSALIDAERLRLERLDTNVA